MIIKTISEHIKETLEQINKEREEQGLAPIVLKEAPWALKTIHQKLHLDIKL